MANEAVGNHIRVRMGNAEGTERIPVTDYDEVPGLFVAGGWRCHAGAENRGEIVLVNLSSAIPTYASPAKERIENFHRINYTKRHPRCQERQRSLICGHIHGILRPGSQADARFIAHELDVVNVETTLALIVGAVAGALVALVIGLLYTRQARVLAGQLLADNNEQRAREVQILLDRVKDSFGTLSLDALSRNSSEFLRLANESLSRQTMAGGRELEGKKALIDASLLQIEKDLLGVQTSGDGALRKTANRSSAR